VESVSLQTLGKELATEGETCRMLRHGAMEGSIETGDVRHIRKSIHGSPNHIERWRQMQRREANSFGELSQNLGRDSLMLAQSRSAVNDSMTDSQRMWQRRFS
jgi:hypothetical protein